MAWGAHCLVQSSVSERKVGLVQQVKSTETLPSVRRARQLWVHRVARPERRVALDADAHRPAGAARYKLVALYEA